MNHKPLFLNTLTPKTSQLITLLQNNKPDFLRQFYLSGGTALSLQLGHRQSEDLDFFTPKAFNPHQLQKKLLSFGNLKQTQLTQGTVNTFLNGVQLQFLEYPYGLIKPLVKWQILRLSSINDIACTKLQTISMRGSKKDFVDLYFLLEKFSLNQLFNLMKKKYPKIDYHQAHILKSLIYFKDAEPQPMPRLHQKVNWQQIKKRLIKTVKAVNFSAP